MSKKMSIPTGHGSESSEWKCPTEVRDVEMGLEGTVRAGDLTAGSSHQVNS